MTKLTTNPRLAYGETIVELAAENRNIVVLDADLCKSTVSVLVQDRFPERFFEMGIAEQNMASTAAGLALAGKMDSRGCPANRWRLGDGSPARFG